MVGHRTFTFVWVSYTFLIKDTVNVTVVLKECNGWPKFGQIKQK